jgi:multidrug efflux pump subunit AcrB
METPEQKIINKRGPIAWMAGRSVTANLLMLVLLIGGFVMAKNIGKDVFPDFELDLVTITLIYPGASPEEVERGTLLAVEEAIQDIEGIKEITATAREGSGTVTVEVIEGEKCLRGGPGGQECSGQDLIFSR